MAMIAVIFILSTLSFAFTSLYFLRKKQNVKKRIEKFFPQHGTISVTKQNVVPTKIAKNSMFKNTFEHFSKNIKTSEQKRSKLGLELESAGLPLKVEEFIAIRIIIFGVAFIFLMIIGVSLTVSIVISLIGWILPNFYVKRKKETRIAASASQLPQALETMASAMKSGFSFMQAMQLVSKELPDPIGIEFQRTIKEINLGIPTETSFQNLLQRLPNKDLEIVVNAVLIQRSTGGNLATILETIQDTISDRVRLKDELKALTSQGRMSALVITLLPVVLGLLLNVMNPDYFTPMFSHPLGWVLLAGGSCSGLLGWIFIQKVVTIEV
ncbi:MULTISPECIES: type II secretion system F family protein [Bacillaceae]|uniref:Type II secretion system F family protein n=1 Tax=Evansella alkalicola TaxID=745819 RepID=A0ABS6JTB9_9BACI|nr:MULTISPECIES: type II secretion system F family protein [Bacillaceae]MBU9721321.1 type II secretion system F family protein [Bacillus alkalicola]